MASVSALAPHCDPDALAERLDAMEREAADEAHLADLMDELAFIDSMEVGSNPFAL